MDSIKEHFDNIAPQYDGFKQKNHYYYQTLKNFYNKFVPANSRVLEIGCGTGDILAHINPKFGVGIDLSPKMIEIARQKYGHKPNLSFFASTLENWDIKKPFEYIFMSDVVEHLENVEKTLAHLPHFCRQGTVFINNMANPLWEPVLIIAEKLKFKMAEGPHYRISPNKLFKILNNNQFQMVWETYHCLIPKKTPISNFINNKISRIRPFNKLGCIHHSIYVYNNKSKPLD